MKRSRGNVGGRLCHWSRPPSLSKPVHRRISYGNQLRCLPQGIRTETQHGQILLRPLPTSGWPPDALARPLVRSLALQRTAHQPAKGMQPAGTLKQPLVPRGPKSTPAASAWFRTKPTPACGGCDILTGPFPTWSTERELGTPHGCCLSNSNSPKRSRGKSSARSRRGRNWAARSRVIVKHCSAGSQVRHFTLKIGP